MDTKFVAYLTEAPVIQIREDVAHVIDRSGETRIERSMSIRSLEKYVERGRRALERHAKGDTDIIQDD